MADDDFTTLPARIRKQIDSTFDKITRKSNLRATASSKRPNKRRKVEKARAPGGFLADDDDEVTESTPAPGGFIAEEDDAEEEGPTHIPLSLIPSALQILDLPPQDEDILSVFRNAASGWGGSELQMGEGEKELGVSRSDWRAVCAVLLNPQEDDDENDQTSEDVSSVFDQDDSPEKMDVEVEEDEDEEYMEEEDEVSDEQNSEDEYAPGTSTRLTTRSSKKSSRRRSQKSSSPLSDEEDQQPTRITPRQKKECIEAFGLFFPSVEDEDVLVRKRIAIKDIARVADLLKEKLTVEDIVDMLEMFSSSADKTVGLEDFEKIMMATKLV